MSSIVDADDTVVVAAHGVLAGDVPQGAKGIRRVVQEDGTESVYRIDPGADSSGVGEVRSDGEFPDSEAVLWRADRGLVEREVERRGLQE